MNRLLRGKRLPFSADLFLSFPEALLLNSFVSLKRVCASMCAYFSTRHLLACFPFVNRWFCTLIFS